MTACCQLREHLFTLQLGLWSLLSKTSKRPRPMGSFLRTRAVETANSATTLPSLQALQKCCRENFSWNRTWKSPWKMPWNFWWNFSAPLSSGNEARKCPEFLTTNFTPFFTRHFAAANAQFHGIFCSADVCPWALHFVIFSSNGPAPWK